MISADMKHTMAALLLCSALLTVSPAVVGCADNTDGKDSVTSDTAVNESGYKNGDTFVMADHASEVLYPVNEPMLDYAASLFASVYEKYLKDGEHQIVFSVIPDKNAYLKNEDNPEGIPFADYDLLVSTIRNSTDAFASYTDLFPHLQLSDYYYSDLHWKQENLMNVARVLCDAFGLSYSGEYEATVFTNPFVGTYTNSVTEQGLSDRIGADQLLCLENDTVNHITVTDYPDGTPIEGVIYNTALPADKNTYDMYLSGSMPLQVLSSPNATTDRELILFRDSFSASLAPLLCEVYKTVTLVDLRYLGSAVLDQFIDFENQDILFLYSTHLLNRSMIMK